MRKQNLKWIKLAKDEMSKDHSSASSLLDKDSQHRLSGNLHLKQKEPLHRNGA